MKSSPAALPRESSLPSTAHGPMNTWHRSRPPVYCVHEILHYASSKDAVSFAARSPGWPIVNADEKDDGIISSPVARDEKKKSSLAWRWHFCATSKSHLARKLRNSNNFIEANSDYELTSVACIGATVNANVTAIKKVTPWKPGRPVSGVIRAAVCIS